MPRLRRNAANWSVAVLLACLLAAIYGLAVAGAAEPSGPEGDHLVVSRVPVAANAQAVTIVRFNGAGVSDGADWALPTAPSGSNNRFTLEGDSTAVGALALSADERYVTLAGYTQPLGTTLGNSSDTAPRVVARIDPLGNIDTSTTLSTNFTQEKIRGAVTNDGSGFWVTGHGNTASPKGGMVYAALGSSKPTVLFTKESVSPSNSAFNNTRTVQIGGGSVYFGSEKGTAGIYRLNGLPTTAQAPTTVAAFGADGSGATQLALLKHEPSASAVDLMYVVQEGSGIYKFSSNGSTWTNRGKAVSGTFNGVVAKVDSEAHFRLYAISGGGAANQVVTMTDTAAYNAAPAVGSQSVVATAASGTAFRGLAFAPHDSTLAVPGAPSGLSATAGDAKATLSWTGPSEDGGSPITGYKITPYISGVAQSPVTTPTTATSYTVEGLSNGTAYTFTVAAVNANGTGAASAASSPVTPSSGAATPTISLADESLEGTVGDPTNPTVAVTVAQSGVEAKDLTVAASASSKASVAAVGGVSVAGSGATRTVSVTPAGGVGYADLTLKVTGAEGKSATTTLHYAASAASPSPSTSRYPSFASDASTAQDVGGGYVILGNDENNVLRMYKADTSGAPVKTWDFNSQMGSPEEIDIEASARVGNTIYWTGSMGNSKKGNLKPDRSILFTTKVTGSGAATELSFGGYYRGLRADLIKWDEEHGNRFGFAAGAAAGNVPKQINGFNVEGMEFAPSSTESAYIGFRAPLSPASAGGKALLVPVTNLASLATSGQNTSLHASFGEPILIDLGGLSVREIRKNAAGEYLIVAGSWAATGSQALYSWDGMPAHAPVKLPTAIPAAEGSGEDAGAWEGILATPEPISSGADVALVMDQGAADLYGDGAEAKELIPAFQKSRIDHFTLTLPAVAPKDLTAPVASGRQAVGHPLTCSAGEWSGSPVPSLSYRWQRNGGNIAGAAAGTYTTTTEDAGAAIGCVVTASNSAGSLEVASNTIEMPAGGLFCSGVAISGAGSALQAVAHGAIWGSQFPLSVCPGGPAVSYASVGSGDPAAMSAWNADGLSGAIDHGTAFVGTDEAPSAAQIASIKAAAGGTQLAVVPVAQTAVAVIASPPAGCTVEEITSADLTAAFEGRLTKWSQLATAEGSCGAPIVRVVPRDAEGVTTQFKNYLFQLNKKGLACAPGKATWQGLQAQSTVWPESCVERALSPLVRPASAGGAAEAATVAATQGSIGFATLPDATAAGATTLRLQDNGFAPAAEAAFASPSAGPSANCGEMSYKRPAGGGGLDLDWSGVYGAKPAIGAGAYPLCMLTYVLAFHGYEAAGFSVGQGATVKDYVNGYVVTAAGQAAVEADGYAPLPSSTLAQFDILGEARKAAGKIAR